MRFIKISREEFARAAKLYEGVMSQACFTLYYREGQIYGDELGRLAEREGQDYFGTLEKLLVGRGWADEAKLGQKRAAFKGSMEASAKTEEGCHRLRGIVKGMYERRSGGRKLAVIETECEGQGGKACVFDIEGFGEVL